MVLTNKVGDINYNNLGSKMTVIEYTDYANIIVQFEDGYITKATYGAFKKRTIRNPYDISVLNVGYIGEGKYQTSVNNAHTSEYKAWRSMLVRCYSEAYQKREPTYIGCEVCTEWHNYQIFAEWYNDNYYTIEKETMALDKDILVKGNKMYSPQTCIFVPRNINCLFIKTNAFRGDLPIGVTRHGNKFRAICGNRNNSIHLGLYKTPEEAFNAYKTAKEQYIKKVADEYKSKYPQFPQKLYDAMYKYEVEITD